MANATASPTVPALCARFKLDAAVAALARAEHDPPAFLAALVDAEQYAGAVSFLAHSLPQREAIWWAWTCARRTAPAERPPAVDLALDATERWLAQPTEANRRPTLDRAEEAGLTSAAGCAALAAFLSGGSIAPAGSPDVAAPEFAAARAVAGSVILSAVSPPPKDAPERFRQYIAQGLEVARRIKLWPSA